MRYVSDHGARARTGADHARSKLTASQRDEIVLAEQAGTERSLLARKYGVHRSYIGQIVRAHQPSRRHPWPPEFPGIETPEFLVTTRGSFPPDEVLACTREAMRKDWPLAVELRDRREDEP